MNFPTTETEALRLVKLDQARQWLAEARSLPEVKEVRDWAAAMSAFVQQQGYSLDIQNHAAEIKVRAERKAGELLREMEKAKGAANGTPGPGRGHKNAVAESYHVLHQPKLADLGITKRQSAHWQQEASLPPEQFEQYLARTQHHQKEITSTDVLRQARDYLKQQEQHTRREATRAYLAADDTFTEDLPALVQGIAAGRRPPFQCIYADPPWQYGNQGTRASTNNHYATMTLEALEALPIEKLAAPQCHLHLWCVDENVEALTRTGWKSWKELLIGEEIVAYNPKENIQQWESIQDISAFPYSGPAAAIHNGNSYFLCHTTLNHRWWCANPGVHSNQPLKWREKTSQDIFGLHLGKYIPVSVDGAQLFPEHEELSDQTVELVAWVTTEGTLQRHKRWNSRSIQVFQSAESPYVSTITRLVGKEPVSYRTRAEKGHTKELAWLLPKALVETHVYPFIDEDKQPLWREFYAKLSRRQAALFIQTCIDGDGWRVQRPSGKTLEVVVQLARRRLLHDLQALACMSGIRTHLRLRTDTRKPKWQQTHELFLLPTKTMTIKAFPSEYTGTMWCPSVRSGYWLARANGRTFVTGNTTNGFLFESQRLFAAWGFVFKSSFVWVKPTIGIGNYWRNAHEFLLLGVRGGLTAQDKSLPSWLEAAREGHSEKPERVRHLIERLSPGPYLELFGRQRVEGWTVWGNECRPSSMSLFRQRAAHGLA
jgi:N6-adenosine-specific RNA methylase IME4